MTTNLKTAIQFRALDMQGVNGFPQGKRGKVFIHGSYVIRTDPQGWRIDRMGIVPEAVYGPNGQTHFASAEKAAAILSVIV
jgi:poly(A) polymerase Pap1